MITPIRPICAPKEMILFATAILANALDNKYWLLAALCKCFPYLLSRWERQRELATHPINQEAGVQASFLMYSALVRPHTRFGVSLAKILSVSDDIFLWINRYFLRPLHIVDIGSKERRCHAVVAVPP